jgi:vesicle coat complex subunit
MKNKNTHTKMNNTQAEEVLKDIEDAQIEVDESTSKVLDALKEEQAINKELADKLREVAKAIETAGDVIKMQFACIATLRSGLKAIHEHYGFSKKSMVRLVPVDQNVEVIVMSFDELMDHAENLADRVAGLIARIDNDSDERPPTMAELDKSCGVDFTCIHPGNEVDEVGEEPASEQA